MKKILISFIGNNDCYLSEGKEGAILSILKEREYDFLYILYNDDRFLPYASEILTFCRAQYKNMTVTYIDAKSLNPIDYNIVYPAMVSAIQTIIEEQGLVEVDYTIAITSGTPTMHSCWILISQGGVIPARLIQVSREQGISEIDFNLDDFPKIVAEKNLKVRLAKTNRENEILRRQLNCDFTELIGEHRTMIDIKKQISNLTKYDINVFIEGESGTGKEIVARCLHYYGHRKPEPFVAVNCGAISEKLAESELFGHKKGSFTGSVCDHEGLFGQANGGTIFLDEVGDLPPSLQVKLLRAIESSEITPVGGKTKKINVRVLSASNKNLRKMIKTGEFREDLYYRLVPVSITLPSLRERLSDILLLANHFVKIYNSRYQHRAVFTRDAGKRLLSYDYPGNVRELQNIVNVSLINSFNEEITAEDIILPKEATDRMAIRIPPEGIDLNKQILPLYYSEAMRIANGNASEAARLLGIKPHTFRERLKKLCESNYYDLDR
jgi:DNA-binding NtrC family response regulator